jgi:hypothetical protein
LAGKSHKHAKVCELAHSLRAFGFSRAGIVATAEAHGLLSVDDQDARSIVDRELRKKS